MTDINTLLNSRPGPLAIPQLQAHVSAQAKGETPYVFDAVRLLIKHYQLFPDSAEDTTNRREFTAVACLLALREYSNMTDFLALVYMIPPNVMAAEPCASLQALADALDACQYDAFWKQLTHLQSCEHVAIATLAKQSVSAFQTGILSVLALTYKQALSSVVLKALHMDSVAGITILQHSAIESLSDDLVTFKSTTDNTKRERVFQESVGFGAITSLMSKLAQ
jgi:hypothetical protein